MRKRDVAIKFIESPRKRRATYRNRIAGLKKKCMSLGILCGVTVTIVVQTGGQQGDFFYSNHLTQSDAAAQPLLAAPAKGVTDASNAPAAIVSPPPSDTLRYASNSSDRWATINHLNTTSAATPRPVNDEIPFTIHGRNIDLSTPPQPTPRHVSSSITAQNLSSAPSTPNNRRMYSEYGVEYLKGPGRTLTRKAVRPSRPYGLKLAPITYSPRGLCTKLGRQSGAPLSKIMNTTVYPDMSKGGGMQDRVGAFSSAKPEGDAPAPHGGTHRVAGDVVTQVPQKPRRSGRLAARDITSAKPYV